MAAFAVSLLGVGCGASSSPAASPAEREVLAFAAEVERIHPDPFHAVTKARFHEQAAALASRAAELSRDELAVGLMRLLALGERDGHTGVFPADAAHARPFSFYPLQLYAFPTGLHVVAAPGREELVGARLTAVDGVPVDRVVREVEPLVPHDNEWSRLDRLPEWIVTADVLAGLGLTRAPRRAPFAFADGRTIELEATPAAPAIHGLPPPPGRRRPLWLQRPDDDQLAVTIRGGRVVYAAYRRVRDGTELAERITRLAQKPSVRRVILDVRRNGGGDNTTYGSLLAALERPALGRKLVVLVGRRTYSAAGNFVADVAARTRARLVGEPSGGAPSQWGDSVTLALPLAGLTAHVATVYHDYGPGSTTQPDVRVDPTAEDFFAGRDTVLERAVALP